MSIGSQENRTYCECRQYQHQRQCQRQCQRHSSNTDTDTDADADADADAGADADAVVASSEIIRELQHFHETLLRIHTDYATYQEF
nr:expressed protein [Hymenolepis microstoma]